METTGRYNDHALTSDLGLPKPSRSAVAAVFPDRELARDAAHELHHDGFRSTWIGIARPESSGDYVDAAALHDDAVMRTPADTSLLGAVPPLYLGGSRPELMATRADEAALAVESETTRVESDNWFMRFFGEGDESLHDALVRHGVDENDARTAGSLPAHGAVVTVDGENHPELAAEILSQAGGRVITSALGATGYGTAGRYESAGPVRDDLAVAPSARTASLSDDNVVPGRADAGRTLDTFGGDATKYDDYGRYRAGTPVDESTRLQLREERLRIDKERISRGEATAATDVAIEAHDTDMPYTREELFIERRSATRVSVPADDSPITANEGGAGTALTQESVTGNKVPVVAEDVIVGKREVWDTEPISQTAQRE